MPKIDNLLLFRCVQVTRRLQLKSRDVGLFCNISASTLTDANYFQQFLDFMDANRALASALMFEFTQSAYRDFGPIEHESLAALAERGFRFSHGPCQSTCAWSRRNSPTARSASSRCRPSSCSTGPPMRRATSIPDDLADLLGALRHRSDRRAHRKREHGGRSARLRRALRPGLPVLAAAAGAAGGLARRGPGRARDRRRADGLSGLPLARHGALEPHA